MSAPEELASWDETFATLSVLRGLPTPCYVYDEAGLRARARRLRRAFAWNPGFRQYFPICANPNPTILRILQEEGQGALCLTAEEFALARCCGLKHIRFAPAFSGVAEPAVATVDLVLDDGSQLMALERMASLPPCLGLRLRADRPGRRAQTSRFGMSPAELCRTARELRLLGVRRIGLAAPPEAPSPSETLTQRAEQMFTLAAALSQTMEIAYCDLGGGLPIALGPQDQASELEAVSQEIQTQFDRILRPAGLGGCPVQVSLGRWMTGPSGVLLTGVTGVKHGTWDWLGVDLSRGDLLRPTIYGGNHHISVLGDARLRGRRRYAIGDRSPEYKECFTPRLLPECRRGSVLVIHNVGAYGHSMGYQFGSLPRCAEYLLERDGNLRCIRRREGLKELFATLEENADFTAPQETR